jgi:hypothetical protein
MSAAKLDVRDECGRAIELLRELAKRKIKLVAAAAYEWPYPFHVCQLI